MARSVHAADQFGLATLPRLVQVLLLAGAYFVTGKLGLLLALPPGYATAVWPPSGIALAGLLLFGYRAWPGVWLGSFSVNVGTSVALSGAGLSLTAIGVPASIAAGATLQAVFGVFLLRRYVKFPTALADEKDVGRFLLLCGVLSPLVNATIGTTALLLTGAIASSAYPFSWWTWWVGDAIGIILFTPLVFVWTAAPRETWLRRRLTLFVPLVITFAMFIVLFVRASAWEAERARQQVQRRAERIAGAINTSVQANVREMSALASLYTIYERPSAQQFHDLTVGALERAPDIEALSWNICVLGDQRDAFELAERNAGSVSFQITVRDEHEQFVRAPQRDFYVPVVHIAPADRVNNTIIGYDVLSDPTRAEAIARARDTGQPAVTGATPLFQLSRNSVRGLIFYTPVYRKGAPHETITERRQNLVAFVTGVLLVPKLIEGALANIAHDDFEFAIFDETASPGDRVLYSSFDERTAQVRNALGGDIPLAIGRRTWTLRGRPTASALVAQRSWHAWYFLAIGLLFTGLLGAFLLVVTGRALATELRVTQRLDEREHRFRALLESAPDAMVVADPTGLIAFVNAQAERLFGYARTELIGQPVETLIPQRFRHQHVQHRAGYVDAPKVRSMGSGRELFGIRKDGSEFPVEVSLSPVATEDGVLVSSAIRDITERRSAEVRAMSAAIVESSDDAIYSCALNGDVELWNAASARLFGYAADELVGSNAACLMPADRSTEMETLFKRATEGNAVEQYETFRRRKDGAVVEVSLSVSPVRGSHDQVVGVSVIARDITRAKEVERHVVASLKEKEVLLKEVHHRVKNNLQIISSLLNLQAAKGEWSPAVFTEMQNRVRSIALFHERLYRSSDLSHVNVTDYMRALATSLAGQHGQDVDISVEAFGVQLAVDLAIPCGLIANELITNSLKYAFVGREVNDDAARIKIAFNANSDGNEFVVEDNGRGLPPDFAVQQTSTLGLQLVMTLVEQIHGTIAFASDGGTRVRVTFPNSP